MMHHVKITLVCRNALLENIVELLSECDIPEWLVSSNKCIKLLEFALFDVLRDGLAQHLNGSAPCLMVEYERIYTLICKALGINSCKVIRTNGQIRETSL